MGKIVEKVKARRAKKKDLNITQQNLKESRDEILNKGKKFKYPFQYAKHRVVIYTIAITIVAFASFAGVGWYQLYKAQNTGEVMFRFTKVLRLPVAKVDGVDVLYSDYLMLYRSSIASIERQQGKMDDMNDEVKSQKLFYKRQALDNAEMYSYVLARLDERNLTVSASEIDEVIDEHKSINGEKRSNEAFEGIVRDNFGLSMSEYRRLVMLALAKKKLSIEIDEEAKKTAEKIEELLRANKNDFSKVADALKDNDLVSYEPAGDAVETSNLDSGRAEMAIKLEKNGDVSERFVSKNGDGYYFVRLVKKEDDKVSYETLSVRFSKVDAEVKKLREGGKVKEYIEVKTESGELNTSIDKTETKEEKSN